MKIKWTCAEKSEILLEDGRSVYRVKLIPEADAEIQGSFQLGLANGEDAKMFKVGREFNMQLDSLSIVTRIVVPS